MSVIIIIYFLSFLQIFVSSEKFIIGGHEAAEGAYPYQISIDINEKFKCSGTILNERWILTAAECVYEAASETIMVTAGSNVHSKNGHVFLVEEVIINPGYNSTSSFANLALIKTSTQITMSEKVAPVKFSNLDIKNGTILIVTGWGSTNYPLEIIPERLQELETVSMDYQYCEKYLPRKVPSVEFCAFKKRGEGVCLGDIGSPVVDAITKELVGVVSWGWPCADGFPDVCTRIDAYEDWIFENIRG